MIGPSGNVRVYLACGVTDMRRGIDGLSALVETVVKEAQGNKVFAQDLSLLADEAKKLPTDRAVTGDADFQSEFEKEWGLRRG